MTTSVKFLIFLLCSSVVIHAQLHPFPQNINYPYGFMPKTLDSDWLMNEYTRWKSTAFTACNDTEIYVMTDNGGKVEAVGFGMLISVYMGDKKNFDGLYNFYKINCGSNAGGMMGWIGQCGGNSSCSASDGDVDVAFSLIIASWQWPDGDYLEKAKSVIMNLKKVVVACGDILTLQMGITGTSVYNGCNEIDISYYNPAAFREFAKVTGDSTWTRLAEDTYTSLNAGANATTGLVADRQKPDGSPNGNYGYDACRTPWRICLDYLWNGNEKAHAWCKKISDWAYQVGPKNIRDGYSPAGASNNGNHNMAFTGGFAVAAMANSQAMVDEFGTELRKLRDTYWFTFALTPCYLLTLTGNQWRNDLTAIRKDGKLSRKGNRSDASGNFIRWRLLGGGGLSISGLKPGCSLTLATLSGRLLTGSAATVNSCSLIPLKRGDCVVVAIKDEKGRILKTGFISPMCTGRPDSEPVSRRKPERRLRKVEIERDR